MSSDFLNPGWRASHPSQQLDVGTLARAPMVSCSAGLGACATEPQTPDITKWKGRCGSKLHRTVRPTCEPTWCPIDGLCGKWTAEVHNRLVMEQKHTFRQLMPMYLGLAESQCGSDRRTMACFGPRLAFWSGRVVGLLSPNVIGRGQATIARSPPKTTLGHATRYRTCR